MRYLFGLMLLSLVIAGCSKTASLRAGTSGASASSSATVRDPYSGSSATVRGTDDGVSTSSSKPSWTRYRAPVITENIGGATVRIDPMTGDVTANDRLGPFLVTGDDGGVSLSKSANRWEFCDACYVNGVSMYIDSSGDVNISEPSVTTHNDYVRAGLQKDRFDVAWRGVDFNTALDSLDGIANVRLDASLSEEGFEVSAVPKLQMTLLDVSADYAVHRLATHANLEVYVEAEDRYILGSK
ncbi:MAG: hypothetical protein K8I27_16880 [Planctomycetes bacterium]|nr:hypothetical protein [Planctomycetota bacterium]